MKPYDSLALDPKIVAYSVATQKYTGIELSEKLRSDKQINRIESRRSLMTDSDIKDFIETVDSRCRVAYEAGVDWFMKCLKDNRGRDQLYIWVSHWLSAFLCRK